MQKNLILPKVRQLLEWHRLGQLGGERMPEDANPKLDQSSRDGYLYFTLPMALNYQRNSYTLWESALSTYQDSKTRFVFDPHQASKASFLELQQALLKHKLALQPNRHPLIWQTISQTLVDHYQGDVRNLFEKRDYDVQRILDCVQLEQKKSFPYLSGQKIANYWLYVMTQYTNGPFTHRDALSIAPDTHVIQASLRLGVVQVGLNGSLPNRVEVAHQWKELLAGSGIDPIDVHTPLWLWSRNGFKPE